MKTKDKPQAVEEGVRPGLKIKKLAVQLSVGDTNLASEIKRAFDLAKSSGLELDLIFNHGAA